MAQARAGMAIGSVLILILNDGTGHVDPQVTPHVVCGVVGCRIFVIGFNYFTPRRRSIIAVCEIVQPPCIGFSGQRCLLLFANFAAGFGCL